MWVSHTITERNLFRPIDTCNLLFICRDNYLFLKRIITADGKWVVYNNVKCKKSWSKKKESAQITSEAYIHKKMVILPVRWEFKAMVFFELLPDNTTMNSEVYCHQPDTFNDSLKPKRSELINRKSVVFHQADARPHNSLDGIYYLNHHILQLWHLLIIICSALYKTF